MRELMRRGALARDCGTDGRVLDLVHDALEGVDKVVRGRLLVL